MTDPWFPFIPFVVFFMWLFLFGTRRRKSCADCGELLPPFQSPLKKTKRQWLAGGYVCAKCGCEMDIAGKKVPAGMGARVGSMVTGIALLTLAAVLGVILLTMILQR